MDNTLEIGLNTFGGVTHPTLMRSIELFGTKVAPLLRDMLASDWRPAGDVVVAA